MWAAGSARSSSRARAFTFEEGAAVSAAAAIGSSLVEDLPQGPGGGVVRCAEGMQALAVAAAAVAAAQSVQL